MENFSPVASFDSFYFLGWLGLLSLMLLGPQLARGVVAIHFLGRLSKGNGIIILFLCFKCVKFHKKWIIFKRNDEFKKFDFFIKIDLKSENFSHQAATLFGLFSLKILAESFLWQPKFLGLVNQKDNHELFFLYTNCFQKTNSRKMSNRPIFFFIFNF